MLDKGDPGLRDEQVVSNHPTLVGSGPIYVIHTQGPGINEQKITLSQGFLDNLTLHQEQAVTRLGVLERRLSWTRCVVGILVGSNITVALLNLVRPLGWW